MIYAKFCALIIFVLLTLDLEILCKRSGGFGGIRFSKKRKPTTFGSKYNFKTRKTDYSNNRPSAPVYQPENHKPIGWAQDTSQVKNTAPVYNQPKPLDNNQRPIGWNVANNQQSKPIQPYPAAPPAANINPQQNYNPSQTNFGSYGQQQAPHAPVPLPPQPNGFNGQHYPPSYDGNRYNNYNGFQTGNFAPQFPPRRSFGLGSIAGSNVLGNVLTGLTLWQLLRGGSGSKNYNVYNNYYNNGSAIAIDEAVKSDQNFPIKQRFDNGTLILQDDTTVFPNGTLLLSNGTVFNTVLNDPMNVTTISTNANLTKI